MMMQVLIPALINCHTFQYFVLVLVSLDKAVTVEWKYCFAVHIGNEYCWILMSDNLVLSADCIAAVESSITLCGIEEGKDKSQLNLSQKICVCQKCIKPSTLYCHQLALFLKFVFNLCFQNLKFKVWSFMRFFSLPFYASARWYFATCCGLCIVQSSCLWQAVLYVSKIYIFFC